MGTYKSPKAAQEDYFRRLDELMERNPHQVFVVQDKRALRNEARRMGIELAVGDPKEVKGGLSRGKKVEDIAKKHGVSLAELMVQLKMGLKVEMEHTDDRDLAMKIAKDHLVEDPRYYSKLKKMEKSQVEHIILLEKAAKGEVVAGHKYVRKYQTESGKWVYVYPEDLAEIEGHRFQTEPMKTPRPPARGEAFGRVKEGLGKLEAEEPSLVKWALESQRLPVSTAEAVKVAMKAVGGAKNMERIVRNMAERNPHLDPKTEGVHILEAAARNIYARDNIAFPKEAHEQRFEGYRDSLVPVFHKHTTTPFQRRPIDKRSISGLSHGDPQGMYFFGAKGQRRSSEFSPRKGQTGFLLRLKNPFDLDDVSLDEMKEATTKVHAIAQKVLGKKAFDLNKTLAHLDELWKKKSTVMGKGHDKMTGKEEARRHMYSTVIGETANDMYGKPGFEGNGSPVAIRKLYQAIGYDGIKHTTRGGRIIYHSGDEPQYVVFKDDAYFTHDELKKEHERLVEEALKSGKKLPGSVLKEYPNLTDRYKASASPDKPSPFASRPGGFQPKSFGSKQPWMQKLSDFSAMRGQSPAEAKSEHRAHLLSAMKRGEYVPWMVLKEQDENGQGYYDDLAEDYDKYKPKMKMNPATTAYVSRFRQLTKKMPKTFDEWVDVAVRNEGDKFLMGEAASGYNIDDYSVGDQGVYSSMMTSKDKIIMYHMYSQHQMHGEEALAILHEHGIDAEYTVFRRGSAVAWDPKWGAPDSETKTREVVGTGPDGKQTKKTIAYSSDYIIAWKPKDDKQAEAIAETLKRYAHRGDPKFGGNEQEAIHHSWYVPDVRCSQKVDSYEEKYLNVIDVGAQELCILTKNGHIDQPNVKKMKTYVDQALSDVVKSLMMQGALLVRLD
jgi:hypothetical protein